MTPTRKSISMPPTTISSGLSRPRSPHLPSSLLALLLIFPHLCQLPDDTVTLVANQALDGRIGEDRVGMLADLKPFEGGDM